MLKHCILVASNFAMILIRSFQPKRPASRNGFFRLHPKSLAFPPLPALLFIPCPFFSRSSFGNVLVTPSAALGKPFLPASPSRPHSFLIRDKIQKGILSRLRGCWDEEANGLTFVISVFPLIRPVCLHLASNPLFRSGFPCVPRYTPRDVICAKEVVRILEG